MCMGGTPFGIVSGVIDNLVLNFKLCLPDTIWNWEIMITVWKFVLACGVFSSTWNSLLNVLKVRSDCIAHLLRPVMQEVGGGVSPQGRSVNSLTLRSVLIHNCWCTRLPLLVHSTNCILVHYQTIQCPHTQLLVYTCALPDNTVVSYTNVVCLYL